MAEPKYIDPKNIRSRFAAFDPAKRDSTDLLAANGGAMDSKRTGKAVGGASQFGNTLGSIGSMVNPLGGAARPAPVVAGARPIGVPPPVAPWVPPVPPVPPDPPGPGGGGGGGESSQGSDADAADPKRPDTPSSRNPYQSKPVYGDETAANALSLAGAATGVVPLSLAGGAARLLAKDETNTSRWQNLLPGVSKALTGHDPENYRQQLTNRDTNDASQSAWEKARADGTLVDGGWLDLGGGNYYRGESEPGGAPAGAGADADAGAGADAAATDAPPTAGDEDGQTQTPEPPASTQDPAANEGPDYSARGGRVRRADGGQAVSAAATSRHQVAALLRSAYLARGTTNLDYGGGKYDKGTEFLKTRGVENHVFDPFNRTREHNDVVLGKFKDKPADSATMANVLNVIKEPMLRAVAIRHSSAHVRDGGKIHFSVYAGDRSGKGEKTRDGWQNNMPLRDYLAEVRAVHPDADIYGNAIVATKRARGGSRG